MRSLSLQLYFLIQPLNLKKWCYIYWECLNKTLKIMVFFSVMLSRLYLYYPQYYWNISVNLFVHQSLVPILSSGIVLLLHWALIFDIIHLTEILVHNDLTRSHSCLQSCRLCIYASVPFQYVLKWRCWINN